VVNSHAFEVYLYHFVNEIDELLRFYSVENLSKQLPLARRIHVGDDEYQPRVQFQLGNEAAEIFGIVRDHDQIFLKCEPNQLDIASARFAAMSDVIRFVSSVVCNRNQRGV
jgi:hypothetical protein